MEFLKKLFKDDESAVGLCNFKSQNRIKEFAPKFNLQHSIYQPQYKKNFFLL